MRIAVIGAGVAGMGAALALSERHDVRLFEAAARFGGHANTVDIETIDGERVSVDTGFIVFNERNYPNLCGLFEHLGVATEASDMTFSLSLDGGRLEYACDGLHKVFAQRWRAFDPRYWAAFLQIRRFCREAEAELAAGGFGDATLRQWLDARGYRAWMRENFLCAMGGAIWSTPLEDIEDFPIRAFVQFFKNHELLAGFERRISWRTVSGGSRSYVAKLLQRLGPRAQAGLAARSVRREAGGQVRVAFADGSEATFDEVVLAVHADEALALLADASLKERARLGAIRYAPNTAVLHGDATLMPKLRRVWSSWNVLAETGGAGRPPAVSYWMNRLQNLTTASPLVVTLNPPVEPRAEFVYGRYAYAHPQFDGAAFAAQAAMDDIQGRGGVWYAGAWLGWGFHEDGLKSGLRVAEALGARPAWARATGEPLARGVAIAAE